MRTTIDLDPDVQAAVEALQREQGIGRSRAVNELARRGALPEVKLAPYRLKPVSLGTRIDVTNIGEVLDMLDEA